MPAAEPTLATTRLPPACTVHQPPELKASETRARAVTALTLITMVVELVAGWLSGSLALTADGWHMATHVGALGLAAAAYWFARTRAGETRFAFGTGKVYSLAGYTSAGMLLVVAVAMVVESVERFIAPRAVDFADAFPVAVGGLVVNLVSAWLLGGVELHHHAGDDHHHAHGHDHHHHDHNLRAAYVHVLADALTSVLAIAALVLGRYLGWLWADPAVAVVGAAVITRWGVGLLRESAAQLVDLDPSADLQSAVRRALEAVEDTTVEDLHLWRVGPGQLVCVVRVTSSTPLELEEYQQVIQAAAPVSHLTVEICRRKAA